MKKKKKETTIRVHQEFGIPDAVHDSIDALCKEAKREGCFVVVETNDAGEISLRKVRMEVESFFPSTRTVDLRK